MIRGDALTQVCCILYTKTVDSFTVFTAKNAFEKKPGTIFTASCPPMFSMTCR